VEDSEGVWRLPGQAAFVMAAVFESDSEREVHDD
jgi:hypothetical protein